MEGRKEGRWRDDDRKIRRRTQEKKGGKEKKKIDSRNIEFYIKLTPLPLPLLYIPSPDTHADVAGIDVVSTDFGSDIPKHHACMVILMPKNNERERTWENKRR